MKVLIYEWLTDGGLAGDGQAPSLAAEGRAIRTALTTDFQAVAGVTVVTAEDSRGPVEVSRDPLHESAARLTRLARGCDFTVLVAPETGGIHSALARALPTRGPGRSLGPSRAAVGLVTDKFGLCQRLRGQGVRVPDTYLLVQEAAPPHPFTFPAVAKPRTGAGSENTFCVASEDDLAACRGKTLDPILQPLVPGVPMSASFLVENGGEPRLLAVGRQAMARSGSRFVYEGGAMPEPSELGVGEPARAVRAVPGLRGFVGVDFIHDPATGLVTVLEINPRPTTSYVGLVHLFGPGAVARAWLALAQGETFVPPVPRPDVPPFRFLPDGTLLPVEIGP